MTVHVRLVDLPGGPGRLALLTLDSGDARRPFVLGPTSLPELADALDRARSLAEAGEVVAIGVTGTTGAFCAGADLKQVATTVDREQALATARQGHDVLGRLATAPVPTFAFVGGTALGGGLETALHAHHRTVSTGVRSIGLPEAHLGLVPGWGGTHLLPRLTGPDAAVRIAVENPLAGNRTLTGPQALAAGVVDVAFDPADFLVSSLRWAGAVVRGEVVVDRPAPADGAAWDAAVERGRAVVRARVHGASPAPDRVLDLLASSRTLDRAAQFEAEEEALGDLIVSPELRASLYAFDLVQRYGRKPTGAPSADTARPVGSVGVVGAGLMASQLALLFLHRLQVPVVLTDVDAERVERGTGFVRQGVDDLLAKGRITSDTANRLRANVSGSVDKSALADCDVVV